MGEQHEAARRSRRWQRSIRALVDPDYRVLASLASIQDWALWRQLWRRVDSGGAFRCPELMVGLKDWVSAGGAGLVVMLCRRLVEMLTG